MRWIDAIDDDDDVSITTNDVWQDNVFAAYVTYHRNITAAPICLISYVS